MRRAVITGIGAVTPIGTGVEGLWDGVRREQSAVSRLTRFEMPESGCQIAAQIDDFRPEERLDPKRLKRLDRYSRLALVAGLLALEDAELSPRDVDPERTGVTIGSALAGIGCAEEENQKYQAAGLRAVSPMLALSVFGGAASCNLSIEFGFHGYNSANSDSCASSPIAMGGALNAIRRGDADVMLAGGIEAPLFPLTFGAFALIRAMSTRNDDPAKACRPFDRSRDGFVMAEGGALFVIEERERALARGARIYAELAGFGVSNDAGHMTAPRADGTQACRAMRLAMKDAGVSPSDIDYVNAHASSTPLNDGAESRAIRMALGDWADRVPVSGTKAMHGHSLGATGAVEAAICSLALQRSWVPPTVNLEEPGDGCDLDYVAGTGRAKELGCVLSNSFGFGGINAAIVLTNPARA